ncbi:MAG: cytochrome c [Deltaproteobacteria bacterium]|nr:cytochrome c [Deltaproteobacteria bacterium]
MIAWSTRGVVILALMGGCVLWGMRAPASAQTSPEQEVMAAGKPVFEQYCATCHGGDAKGGGVASNMLTVKPADLTMISKNNNGTFPFWRMYGVVDGREQIKGHGTRDMPIWGAEFRTQAASNITAQSQVRGRILELVYYLQSIQAK